MKKSSSFIQKTKSFAVTHKLASVVIVGALVVGGYFTFHTKATAETRYVTTPVTTGTVVASVTGSGQVSASNQVNLQSKASGTITSVDVKAGQAVSAGQTLVAIDSSDAERSVQTAQTSLETAQLDLDQFTATPDPVSVLALKQAIATANQSKTDADTAITTAYSALLNSSVTAVASDISNNTTPPTITGTYTGTDPVTINIAAYQAGTGAFFNATSVPADIVPNAPGYVSSVVPQPIGSTGLFIKFPSNNVGGNSNWVITLPNKAAPNYSANLTAYQNAQSNKELVDDAADLTIAQNNEKMNDLYTPDALTLRGKQLAVEQAQNALDDAKSNLADDYITAPFSGTIATMTAQVGATASGTLGTIITHEQLATVSLNEVDVAKIKLGDKATLTFDAVDGLSIAGTVASIDSVGTVTQGVVNYNVQISFATQDARIKPGMSVDAAIVTAVDQDVLLVPSSAVKTTNGSPYVQVFDTALPPAVAGTTGSASPVPPRNVQVVTGLSDDTNTEITSGLTEGQLVVSRTVTGTTTTATTAAPSLLGGAGGRGALGGGGGAAFRGAAGR